jgi:hypothetical protein
VHQKLIYESKIYHNIVFVGTNENGVAKHAHKRSTSSNSGWRQNQAGSEAAFSFHQIGKSDVLYAVEAPIDMLSFISMYQKDWQKHSYVSLCGVSGEAIMHQLLVNENLREIVLCLDNDSAGRQATERISKALTGKGYGVSVLLPEGKDWNEVIINQNTREVQKCSLSLG